MQDVLEVKRSENRRGMARVWLECEDKQRDGQQGKLHVNP